MEANQLVSHAQALRVRITSYSDSDYRDRGEAARAQVSEFLREYAGSKSSFLKRAESIGVGYNKEMVSALDAILESFIEYVQAGLATGLSPARQAQIDVVSDVLGQAQVILDGPAYHPAGAAMLAGAALEEFLRNWVEEAGLNLGNSNPGIDAYSRALRGADLLTKQDVKDITAWAGMRNHAAHGEWDAVSNREGVRIMLNGVNLFMRQKTS